MRKFGLLFVILLMPSLSQSEEHALFTNVLQQYVTSGKVHYKDLCKDGRLEEYIAQLKSANPDSIADNKSRLAFWINAYNAYTLKAICARYPVKSINELHSGGLVLGTVFNTTVWDKDFVIIHQKLTTLNNIEHKIIRPVFKDPRIHFALVCAAKSCPPLRSEAYEGSKLEEQLDDQARIFLRDAQQNRFDAKQKKAYLSRILDWYGGDFGKNKAELMLYLAQYLSADTADAIRTDVKKWEVKHNDYDWSLNE